MKRGTQAPWTGRDSQEEHPVGTPFEEDLAEFRRSGLGQAILEGEAEEAAGLEQFDEQERRVLRRLLEEGAE